MKDTLVIFGSFDDGEMRGAFRWNRQDADLWVFNEAVSKNTWVQWANGVIQMHLPSVWRNPGNRNDAKYYDWLKANDAIPIYMQDKYDDVPMSVKYPFDEIVSSLLPHFERDKNDTWDDRNGYFTSTPAYAIALGIYKGYKRIELWGFGLAISTEYVYQRPCVMFWAGIALGRGIEVLVKGHMFDAPLYGFQGDDTISVEMLKARYQAVADRIDKFRADLKEKTEIAQAITQDFKAHKASPDKLSAALMQMAQAQNVLAQQEGVLFENKQHIDHAEKMREASGNDDYRFPRSIFELRRSAFLREAIKASQDRDITRLAVEQAFPQLSKSNGHKPTTGIDAILSEHAQRSKLVDDYIGLYLVDLANFVKLVHLQVQISECEYYMRIFDEQYRAAGKAEHSETAGGPKELAV